MVTRPRMPDGKRVTLSVKVSEDVAGAVDAARGSVSRSEWLQSAILTLLRRDAGRLAVEAVRIESPHALGAARRSGRPVADEVHLDLPPAPPGESPRRSSRKVTREPKPDAAREVPFSSAPDPCPHPKARVHKGLCGACGTYVG